MIDPEGTDEGKATVTHVARRDLPWRMAALTECGLSLAEHAAISPADLEERVKKLGQQRTAMMTCMTCWQTSYRYHADRTWQGPTILTALEREIQWARRQRPAETGFMRDLKAIEILIGRHREEFDELVEDQERIVPIGGTAKVKRPRGRQRW